MQLTPQAVESWGGVIRPDPVVFVAVIFFLSTLFLGSMWITSRRRVEALKDEERVRDDEERKRMDLLRELHKTELLTIIEEAHAREREEAQRNFMHLQVANGFLKLIEEERVRVVQGPRSGEPVKRKRKSAADTLGQEMPTLSLKLPTGGEGDGNNG